MPFPTLEQYLTRLYNTAHANTRVWADNSGRVLGRYFNSTLTSAFQPIRRLDSAAVVGYEGFARSYTDSDQGLSLWRLLDHAASDDESVELDRLCRMLHAINFFRQAEAAGDLYLSVHARLLAAVDGNHGAAFNRVLKLLELPQQRIVLQLPSIAEHQGWLLNYVADNYRRNGFRIAVNANDANEAIDLLERVRPETIKLDTRGIVFESPVLQLLARCAEQDVRVIFKRVETEEMVDTLRHLAALSGCHLLAQGYYWDMPGGSLAIWWQGSDRPVQGHEVRLA